MSSSVKKNWIERKSSEPKGNQWHSIDKMACLFCSNQMEICMNLEHLHVLKKIAAELHDTKLMVRMKGGDLIALEAKYHLACLTTIKNHYQSSKNQQGKEHDQSSEEDQLKAMAFVELLTHIENCVENEMFSFKFSVLHQLYEKRLL